MSGERADLATRPIQADEVPPLDQQPVGNAATVRTNLGLGSAATHPSTDFDTAGAAAAAEAASVLRDGTGMPSSVQNVVAGASAHLVPSGGDDTAQMIAALTSFAPFVSPFVMLGPGTFLWNTQVPSILRSTPTRVRASGRGQTKIRLSAAAPRFLDFDKVADGDTFSQITIQDLTLDVNNTGGQNHKLIGTYRAGVVQGEINLDGITIDNVELINVPTPTASTSPDHPLGVFLTVACKTQKGTGTQYSITNVTVSNYRQTGGHQGVTIAGTQDSGYSGDSSVNVFLDQIRLENAWHDTGALSTVAVGDNFQIGSRGFGDRVLVINAVGLRGGDEGLEINGMSDITVADSVFADALNDCVLVNHFTPSSNPERARVLFDNVQTRHTLRATQGYGWGLFSSSGSTLGDVRFRDCDYLNTTADQLTIAGQALLAANSVYDRLELEGFTATYTAAAPSNAGAAAANPVRIDNVTNGAYVGLRDVSVEVTCTKTGAGTLAYTGVVIGGAANTEIHIDGVSTDFECTLSAGLVTGAGVEMGHAYFWTGRAVVKGVTTIFNGLSNGQVGVRFGDNWTPVGISSVSDCDFTSLPAASSPIQIMTASTSASLRSRSNSYGGGAPVPAALTGLVTATGKSTGKPYTCEAVFAPGSGAGITAIDVSTDGTNYTNVLTQAGAAMPAGNALAVMVPSTGLIKVTFATTQPTITLVPLDP